MATTKPLEIITQKDGVKLTKALPKLLIVVDETTLDQINRAKAKINDLEITDQASYEVGAEYQKGIAKLLKALNATHKAAKDPFKSVLDQADAVKKVLANSLEDMKKILGGKLGDHIQKINNENRLAREKAAREAAEAERLLKEKEASAEAQRVQEAIKNGDDPFGAPVQAPVSAAPVPVVVTQKVEKVSGMKEIKKPDFRMITQDWGLIPEHYIIRTLDEAAIRKDIRDGKIQTNPDGSETQVGKWCFAWIKIEMGSSGR